MTSTPAVGSMGFLPGHPGGDMPEPTPILPPKSKTAEHVEKSIKDSAPHYLKGLSSKQISECLDKNREKSKKAIKIKGKHCFCSGWPLVCLLNNFVFFNQFLKPVYKPSITGIPKV